jgi:hypothetical protein
MRLNTKELINELVEPFNLKYEDLQGSKIENYYIRQCLVYWLITKFRYTYEEAANTFNLSNGGVYAAMEKMRKDKLNLEFNTRNL